MPRPDRLTYLGVVGSLLFGACVSWGLGPHELALIVNRRVPASVRVADHYRALRGVPRSHVIEVDVPLGENPWVISPAAFRAQIFDPVCGQLEARGLSSQILAWAYSVGFPTRVATKVPVSIHGMTFLRCSPPEPTTIAEGRYRSPLFAGGDHEHMRPSATQSLDAAARWLADDMPLPAISLGVIGEHACTVEQVLANLERSARSDATRPSGPIYFVEGNDLRIRCRRWQFESTAFALRRARMDVHITNSVPVEAEGIVGLFTGTPTDQPGRYDFAPGALVDNLTSFGGAFDIPVQTKLTEWLNAGAALCSGTVTEPLSNYRKFPVAVVFAHYATGCTAIEAYYQSVMCPLQQLVVGDPLAAPFARVTEVEILGLPDSAIMRRRAEVTGAVADPLHYNRHRFTFLVDGRVLGRGARWDLDPAALAPGTHTLRIVAYTYGAMRSQSFRDCEFVVPPRR